MPLLSLRSNRRSIRHALALATSATVLLLAGCGGTTPATTAQAPAPADKADANAIHPQDWPELTWPLADDPALEKRIDALMAGMSVEQKVGQTVQGDIASMTPDDVRRYHIGSVLAGGNSDPGGKYDAPPSAWLALPVPIRSPISSSISGSRDV